jgi:hypothetical protein
VNRFAAVKYHRPVECREERKNKRNNTAGSLLIPGRELKSVLVLFARQHKKLDYVQMALRHTHR